MSFKMLILPILFCVLAASMGSCQESTREIELERLMNEDGHYQYADIEWAGTLEETEELLGITLGDPYDSTRGVESYDPGISYEYNGASAKVTLEFFEDNLYHLSFTFYAADNADDVELGKLFSNVAQKITDEYGKADEESLGNSAEVLGYTLETDHYIWESRNGDRHTALTLQKSKRNGAEHSVVLALSDVSLSPKPTE